MAANEEITKVAAPGKVILHGEHSVVYGKRAIAVSVDLCTTLTLSPQPNSIATRIVFPEVDIDLEFQLLELQEILSKLGPKFTFENLNSSQEIQIEPHVHTLFEGICETKIHMLACRDENLKPAQRAAIQAFLFLYLGIFSKNLQPLSLFIETKLPVGAGLGSSASFAVALAGGLLQAAKILSTPVSDADLSLVNRWAFISEKFVHGSPSGVDNTVATFGHGVIFRKGEPYQLLNCPDIRVLLVNTKVARSTKMLVAKVAGLQETDPSLFNESINEMETIVEAAYNEILQKSRISPELVTKNQDLLRAVGVSHPTLDSIVDTAKEYGLAGKLTGAGGGGCAFILIPFGTPSEVVASLRAALEKMGFESWDTKLGCEGFRVL